MIDENDYVSMFKETEAKEQLTYIDISFYEKKNRPNVNFINCLMDVEKYFSSFMGRDERQQAIEYFSKMTRPVSDG